MYVCEQCYLLFETPHAKKLFFGGKRLTCAQCDSENFAPVDLDNLGRFRDATCPTCARRYIRRFAADEPIPSLWVIRCPCGMTLHYSDFHNSPLNN